MHFRKKVLKTGNLTVLDREFVSLHCTELFPQVFVKLFLLFPTEQSFSALRQLSVAHDKFLHCLALMCFEWVITREQESNTFCLTICCFVTDVSLCNS